MENICICICDKPHESSNGNPERSPAGRDPTFGPMVGLQRLHGGGQRGQQVGVQPWAIQLPPDIAPGPPLSAQVASNRTAPNASHRPPPPRWIHTQKYTKFDLAIRLKKRQKQQKDGV